MTTLKSRPAARLGRWDGGIPKVWQESTKLSANSCWKPVSQKWQRHGPSASEWEAKESRHNHPGTRTPCWGTHRPSAQHVRVSCRQLFSSNFLILPNWPCWSLYSKPTLLQEVESNNLLVLYSSLKTHRCTAPGSFCQLSQAPKRAASRSPCSPFRSLIAQEQHWVSERYRMNTSWWAWVPGEVDASYVHTRMTVLLPQWSIFSVATHPSSMSSLGYEDNVTSVFLLDLWYKVSSGTCCFCMTGTRCPLSC